VTAGRCPQDRDAAAVAVLVLRIQERHLRCDVRRGQPAAAGPPGRAGLAHRPPGPAPADGAGIRGVQRRGRGALPAAVPADNPGLRALARLLRTSHAGVRADADPVRRGRAGRPSAVRPVDRADGRAGGAANLQRAGRRPVAAPHRRGRRHVRRPRARKARADRERVTMTVPEGGPMTMTALSKSSGPRAAALPRDTAMRLAATEYQRFAGMLHALSPGDWA